MASPRCPLPAPPAPQFAVREQGESAAVMNMMDALSGCLARGGCAVVPGLSLDHYYFTLVTSLAGGVIAGAASRLEPQGEWVLAARFVRTVHCGDWWRDCRRGQQAGAAG